MVQVKPRDPLKMSQKLSMENERHLLRLKSRYLSLPSNLPEFLRVFISLL